MPMRRRWLWLLAFFVVIASVAVLVVNSKRPAFPVERTVAVCRLAMDLNGDGIRAVKWVAMR
jgi:uncharacterized protein involved in exopolysaccharide biosynthesis